MPPRPITRREFLGQASCAAIGSAALFNTLLNLRRVGTAAAQTVGGSDYRALVCLFLAGGNDSFNMLVPSGNAAHEYPQYQAIRQDLALPQASLLPLASLNDPGRTLGLHPSMSGLQGLFAQGKAAFVANVGTLVERINKAQYENGTVPVPLGLYSHSDQIQQWQTSIPQSGNAIGWGGRTADLLHMLNDNQDISMNISLSGSNVWQSGQEVVEYSITSSGSIGLSGYEGSGTGLSATRGAAVDSQLALEYQNLFEQTFAKGSRKAIDAHYQFMGAINAAPALTTVFPDTSLGRRMRMIARVIAARSGLAVRRQTFFVQYGGWDHHDEVINNQQAMLAEVSQCVTAFYNATVELGIQDSVVLFTASDFGRTLTSNGAGSDHAWGGNHFVLGGPVVGQRIYGQYPDLYADSALDTGRGRLIPTTSVDEYFAELALWMGVDRGNLDVVLPNITRFYNPASPANPLGFLTL